MRGWGDRGIDVLGFRGGGDYCVVMNVRVQFGVSGLGFRV